MKNLLTKKYNGFNLIMYLTALVLVVVLGIMACYKLLGAIAPAGNKQEPLPDVKIEYNEDGTARELETNFLIAKDEPKQVAHHNTAVQIDETNRLVSYTVENDTVEFESNYVAGMLVDAVKYQNKQLFEKSYFSGDMKVDTVNYGEFTVNYGYGEDGRVQSATVDGTKYEIGYGAAAQAVTVRNAVKQNQTVKAALSEASALPTQIFCEGKLIYEYRYDDKDRIVYEADLINNLAYGYEYNGATLAAKKYYRIFDGIAFNYETVDVAQSFDFDFSVSDYGYAYDGFDYVTRRVDNGKSVYYSYMNDKLVMENRDGEVIQYILDGELKYSGLVYKGNTYFYGYDMLGRINSILDEDGFEVVRYYFTSTGELYSTSGYLAATLGKANSVLFDGTGIYDHDKKVYYIADGAYDPSTGLTRDRKTGGITPRSNVVSSLDEYLTKSPVNKHTVIHDRVMQIVSDYFLYEHVEIGYGIYVENGSGDKTGIVDVYTLPYEIAPFSMGNMLNGNQVYDVVYNTPSQLENANAKMQKLVNEDSDSFVNFFSQYKPLPGTMKIAGEFVFLGSLIRYNTIENGIILYDVLENKKSNYSGDTNVYDYDNSKYLLFNKPDYALEMFEGVRLIAGMTQEKYDQVQAQLDIAKINAQRTIDSINAYEDPNIFNTNEHKNIWDVVEVPEGQALVFNEDGSATFQDIPEPDSGRFWKAVALGLAVVATIVVTTVVTIATVGCGTPIVAAICVGALIGVGTGFAIGAVAGATYEIVDALVDGREVEWGQVGQTALEFGTTCAVVGGITGAAVGFGGALGCFSAGTQIATPDGYAAIEDVKVGDKVLSRNDVTGETEEKTVQETFVKSSNDIVKLTVGGKEITATSNHPFYVENKNGYYSAGQLRAGDILVDVNGEKQILEKVQHELLEHPIDVYNFTVEDNHNYFVGNSGILVHNSGLCAGAPTGWKGIDIQNLIRYAKLFGKTLAQVVGYVASGTLTIAAIQQLIIEGEQDRTDELTTTWPQRDKPPKEDEPVYQFAYVLKYENNLMKIGPELNFIEAQCVLLYIALDKNSYKNFLSTLSDLEQNFIMKVVTSFFRSLTEAQDKELPFGIYTKVQKDARNLRDAVCPPLFKGNNDPDGHPGSGNMVQYGHYHLSDEEYEINEYHKKELAEGAYNIHLFYGEIIKPK